jgi:hypothetical protein
VSVLARIRALVDAAPPDGTVTVAWLAELLEAEEAPADPITADHTVEIVAAELGRAVSTVRTWCSSGRIPGAYRLRNREWRIPRDGYAAFIAAEQRGDRTLSTPGAGRVDLGAWRQLRAVE